MLVVFAFNVFVVNIFAFNVFVVDIFVVDILAVKVNVFVVKVFVVNVIVATVDQVGSLVIFAKLCFISSWVKGRCCRIVNASLLHISSLSA